MNVALTLLVLCTIRTHSHHLFNNSFSLSLSLSSKEMITVTGTNIDILLCLHDNNYYTGKFCFALLYVMPRNSGFHVVVEIFLQMLSFYLS